MKRLILYIYHLLEWFFILLWGHFLDAFPKVKKFISTWNEFYTIPMALVLWYFCPILLRWMDPTAATFDSGVLQTYLLAAIGVLLLNGAAWLMIKVSFPGIYLFLDTMFEKEVNRDPCLNATVSERDKMFNLTTWQKCVISLFVLLLYFGAEILLVKLQ